jgi:hypothetical protein
MRTASHGLALVATMKHLGEMFMSAAATATHRRRKVPRPVEKPVGPMWTLTSGG